METHMQQALVKRTIEAFPNKKLIAEALKVSRQSIHLWLGGSYNMSQAHEESVLALLRAANILMDNGIRPSCHILRRMIKISPGLVNETSARRIVLILEREKEQAKANFAEAGVPMLRE